MQTEDVGSFDAIIIGSGMAGLFAANLLVKKGHRVLLLEKHSVPGGYTTNFERKGFRFDASNHFIGGGEPGGMAYETLAKIGAEHRVEFLTHETFGCIVDEARGIEYRAPWQLNEYVDLLAKLFPAGRERNPGLLREVRVRADGPLHPPRDQEAGQRRARRRHHQGHERVPGPAGQERKRPDGRVRLRSRADGDDGRPDGRLTGSHLRRARRNHLRHGRDRLSHEGRLHPLPQGRFGDHDAHPRGSVPGKRGNVAPESRGDAGDVLERTGRRHHREEPARGTSRRAGAVSWLPAT